MAKISIMRVVREQDGRGGKVRRRQMAESNMDHGDYYTAATRAQDLAGELKRSGFDNLGTAIFFDPE